MQGISKKKLNEYAGIPFIFILGSFFHFTYELSGYSVYTAWFSAVNESVWEHLKLTFYPILLYAGVQLALDRKIYWPSFLMGKAVSAYLAPAVIAVGFYAYTQFTEPILAVDIGLFFSAIVLGQAASAALMKRNLGTGFQHLGIGLLVLLGVLYAVFTFIPPQHPLFQDPVTQGYGIHAR